MCHRLGSALRPAPPCSALRSSPKFAAARIFAPGKGRPLASPVIDLELYAVSRVSSSSWPPNEVRSACFRRRSHEKCVALSPTAQRQKMTVHARVCKVSPSLSLSLSLSLSVCLFLFVGGGGVSCSALYVMSCRLWVGAGARSVGSHSGSCGQVPRR